MPGFNYTPSPAYLTQTAVTFATSGSNTLVTGVTGQIVRIYRMYLTAATSTTLTFNDGSTAVSGAMNLAANGQINMDYMGGEPLYTCSKGNSFTATNLSPVQISGTIWSTILNPP